MVCVCVLGYTRMHTHDQRKTLVTPSITLCSFETGSLTELEAASNLFVSSLCSVRLRGTSGHTQYFTQVLKIQTQFCMLDRCAAGILTHGAISSTSHLLPLMLHTHTQLPTHLMLAHSVIFSLVL